MTMQLMPEYSTDVVGTWAAQQHERANILQYNTLPYYSTLPFYHSIPFTRALLLYLHDE